VPLLVVEEPSDRPEWLRETIQLLVDGTAMEREKLLARVEKTPDGPLLLIVERGVALTGLRLAQGGPPGRTGQPRPAAGDVSRAGIQSLAEKTVATAERLVKEFPADPDLKATARHPYYGDLNCFGWLLMLPEHYRAHLLALDRGRPSAL